MEVLINHLIINIILCKNTELENFTKYSYKCYYIRCLFVDFEKTRGINCLRVRDKTTVPAYKQWNHFRGRLRTVKRDAQKDWMDIYVFFSLKAFNNNQFLLGIMLNLEDDTGLISCLVKNLSLRSQFLLGAISWGKESFNIFAQMPGIITN